jgi:hypothetical protein
MIKKIFLVDNLNQTADVLFVVSSSSSFVPSWVRLYKSDQTERLGTPLQQITRIGGHEASAISPVPRLQPAQRRSWSGRTS